jgi:putative flippase GtrA
LDSLFTAIENTGIHISAELITIVKYGFVGVINTGIDYGISMLCGYVLKLDKRLSTAIGYTVGLICSFFLNGSITFRTSGNPVPFLVVNAVSLGVSVLSVNFLLKKLKLPFWLAKGITTVLTMAINFVGYRFWAYR